jgi:hypothetical protein
VELDRSRRDAGLAVLEVPELDPDHPYLGTEPHRTPRVSHLALPKARCVDGARGRQGCLGNHVIASALKN